MYYFDGFFNKFQLSLKKIKKAGTQKGIVAINILNTKKNNL
jgi:hypothetical protein